MAIRVNKTLLVDLVGDDLRNAQELALNLLQKMNDRQFVEWLLVRFPEASTGELNIGIFTDGATAYRFFYKDVEHLIRQEVVKRMAAPRITPGVLAVDTKDSSGNRLPVITVVDKLVKALSKIEKEGPEEPKVYHDGNHSGAVINREWIDWYTHRHSVSRQEAWKVAATKIAKDYGQDLTVLTPIPGLHNPFEVTFVKSVDHVSLY
ncbi:hypothetical protein D3C79_49510 [compost metagenome]